MLMHSLNQVIYFFVLCLCYSCYAALATVRKTLGLHTKKSSFGKCCQQPVVTDCISCSFYQRALFQIDCFVLTMQLSEYVCKLAPVANRLERFFIWNINLMSF